MTFQACHLLHANIHDQSEYLRVMQNSGVGTHAAAGAPAPAEIQDFILISTPEPLSCMLVHPLKKTSSYATAENIYRT